MRKSKQQRDGYQYFLSLRTLSKHFGSKSRLHTLISSSRLIDKAGLPNSEADNFYEELANREKKDASQEEKDTSFSKTVDCFAVSSLHADEFRAEMESENLLKGVQPMSFQFFFARHLCYPVSFFDHPRFGTSDWLEDDSVAVPALVLDEHPSKSTSRFTGFRVSFRNHDEQEKKIYFLTSDGFITCLDQFGSQIWRVGAQVSWLQMSRTVRASPEEATGESESEFKTAALSIPAVYRNSFVPSLEQIKIGVRDMDPKWLRHSHKINFMRKSDQLDTLLAVGWDSVALMDRETGAKLAYHSIPDVPIAPPQRIRSDHDNTFVVFCDDMLIVFAVTQTTKPSTFLSILLALFLTFVVLSWFCPNSDFEDQDDEEFEQENKREQRNKRSKRRHRDI
ncbi:Transcription factor 25 [Cichlidogyrus casuarinus]|uniref:Transcription factor 25 n=1 Tax=Cichlidogyrus casuarinus TaxID=1844966 RepID=A0ABD2Q8V1_9PLAT